jgi:hypothetical protein
MACFDAHVRDAGGLALNTRQQRCAIVTRFLDGVLPTGPILILGIEPYVAPDRDSHNAADVPPGIARPQPR